MGKHVQDFDIADLANKWPSDIVARSEVHNLTGGLIKPQTMANLDSKGEGCPRRVLINGKVGYPVADFLGWLKARGKENQTGKEG